MSTKNKSSLRVDTTPSFQLRSVHGIETYVSVYLHLCATRVFLDLPITMEDHVDVFLCIKSLPQNLYQGLTCQLRLVS